MPSVRFPGPCITCGQTEPKGYYTKHLCKNCYRKQKRRARGLQRTGNIAKTGPCTVCGSTTSSSGYFAKGMCRRCYKRVARDGNIVPRSKYNGPCVSCQVSDPSLKYNRKMCPKCHKRFRNTLGGDNARYRARMAQAINTLTEEQWKRVLEYYNYCCAYCDKDIRNCYTMDHVTPFSKGGSHSIDNVVPSCLSCNSRKQARAPLRPVITLSA